MTKCYLAIDPGVTNGWALFGPQGNPQPSSDMSASRGQIRGSSQLGAFLEANRGILGVVIVEGFNVRRGDPGSHNLAPYEVETLAAIKTIKSFCAKYKIELVVQQPNVKPMGFAWNDEVKGPNPNHSLSHSDDAYAHGIYYLVRNRILKVRRKD